MNDAEVVAYANNTQAQPFVVKLTGAKGNSTAMGARVVVRFDDGQSRVQEVYGGSGYLSQSSSVLYIGIPARARPNAVEVRWPTGKLTSQGIGASAEAITIREEK